LILEIWSGFALLTVNTGGQSVPIDAVGVGVGVGVLVSVEVGVDVGVSAAVDVDVWKPVQPVNGITNTRRANAAVVRGIIR
jgi:hypothetical protein